jgi:hypothetical protein
MNGLQVVVVAAVVCFVVVVSGGVVVFGAVVVSNAVVVGGRDVPTEVVVPGAVVVLDSDFVTVLPDGVVVFSSLAKHQQQIMISVWRYTCTYNQIIK